MNTLSERLRTKLDDHVKKGLYRKPGKSFTDKADFTSNDYLGLAHSPDLFARIEKELTELGLFHSGATGSRLLSGNSDFYEKVERKLASIFRAESALIYNSGYNANLGVLSSIPQKGDTILYDELAHACIKDGARLSLAHRYSFKHNDPGDLERKIKKSKGKIFVAVESIYSMDGDQAPLSDFTELCEKYGAYLILDEAHSTGAYGPDGSGLATQLGIEKKIAIRIYTFGKAMGIHGACIAGEKMLTEYLINFSRPFIYTTALPPHSIAAIDCSFDFLKDNIHLQDELRKKISLFLSLSQAMENKIASKSAIQSILFSGNETARSAAEYLQGYGFDVRPILSPTVRPGTERIRICLHTYNTDEEIENLVRALTRILTVDKK